MEIIEKYTSALTSELAEMKLFNQAAVAAKVRTYLRQCLKDLNEATLGEHNKKFIELVEKQQSYKLNSYDYVQTGFELAKLRPLRAAANQLSQNMKRADRIADLTEKLTSQCSETDFWRLLVKEKYPALYEATTMELSAKRFNQQ